MKNIYHILLPKLARFVSTLEKPRWFVRSLNKWFANHYKIDLSLSTKPLCSYKSLLELFLRELKSNVRPIDSASASVVSPVDAKISAIGKVSEEKILLVKGNPNSISELVKDNVSDYKNGDYMMLYLSPADCHRIYSPISSILKFSKFIPGKVYPVFDKAVKKHPDTFVINKRVVTELENPNGKIMMIKVGALNVGQITVNHPLPFSNELKISYEKGTEIGRFEFGSTVILLFERGKFELEKRLAIGDGLKIGEKIGSFK